MTGRCLKALQDTWQGSAGDVARLCRTRGEALQNTWRYTIESKQLTFISRAVAVVMTLNRS